MKFYNSISIALLTTNTKILSLIKDIVTYNNFINILGVLKVYSDWTDLNPEVAAFKKL